MNPSLWISFAHAADQLFASARALKLLTNLVVLCLSIGCQPTSMNTADVSPIDGSTLSDASVDTRPDAQEMTTDSGSIDSSVDALDSGWFAFPPATLRVVSGLHHSCLLTVDRQLYCWGLNASGQIGDGTTTLRTVPTRVVLPQGLVAVDVAAGEDHTCAVLSDGKVHCWGSNANGKLGDGTIAARMTPTLAADIGVAAVNVEVGRDHSCAIYVDQTVRCWGSNYFGQLGNGLRDDTGEQSTVVPTVVSGLDGLQVLDFSARQWINCVVTSDGLLRCWGRIPRLDEQDTLVPTALEGTYPRALTVSAGYWHMCATFLDNSLRCWGSNSESQMGGTPEEEPIMTPMLVDGIGDVLEVSAGYGATCARADDGGVMCWGRNGDGQVGDGTQSRLVTMPTQISIVPVAPAFGISTGYGFTCAPFADGVRCWGANRYGTLGDGTRTRRLIPGPVVSP